MAGNKRQKPPAVAAQQPPPPSAPTAKATAKYTNKDGSKFITVPKGNVSPVTSPPSPALPPPASVDGKGTTHSDPADPGSAGTTTVNRKKQKRREKAAAKAAAERALHSDSKGGIGSPAGSAAPSLDRRSLDVNYEYSEGEEEHYDHGHDPHDHAPQTYGASAKSKKSKKKKKKSSGTAAEGPYEHHDHDGDDDYDNDQDLDYEDPGHSHPQDHHVHHQHGHIQNHGTVHTHHRAVDQPKKKLWNDSTTEERQGIRQYWYDLSEEERKKLVRIEKEAVLRKMKEQQKQTCSCTVCGRKRNAIEEELEGLYDAYYQELAQYAKRPDQQPNEQVETLPSTLPPRQHHPPVAGVQTARGQPSNHALQPSHARIVEHLGDEEDDSVECEDYSEDDYDDEEDEYSDEEPVDEDSLDRGDLEAFSSFSNSLTVEGGILTVADDLLKNDGRKFIEMMEQLAEKRMQRQEDAYRSRGDYGHPNDTTGYSHNDAPPLEDDEVEYEDEDDDYEGEEDDQDYDSEEEEAMTEKERMEEGRRMFQIFAARMFEQRVLQAYRQKVAKERQEQLIHEEEEAKRKEVERQEKKRRDAQKRKEKAALKKAELAEAKRLKEEAKAKQAEERRMEEERKAEEQRQKAEEKRKKKEAQKRAEEEERKRKEAERLRRIHEQKEKQAEQERKAREAKEKEKKAKEEAARLKEQEAKERKEREARGRKEQQEREKRAQEQEEARTQQAEREVREKKVKQQQRKQEEATVQKPVTAVPITLARRPAQHPATTAAPALPQQPPNSAATVASPLVPVATPIMPLAPTPMRNRQSSQQESSLGSSASHSASSTSQVPSPHSMTPVHASPGPFGPQTKPGSVGGHGGQGIYHQGSQQASPMNINSMHGPFSGFGGPPMAPAMGGFGHGPPPGFQQHPGFGGHSHPNQGFPGAPFGSSFPNQGMMSLQGGINRPLPGRGLSLPQPPPGILPPLDAQSNSLSGQGFPPIGLHRDSTTSLHQRHPSAGGFDAAPGTPVLSSSQPRPAPIRRPGSVVHGQRVPSSLPVNGRDSNETEDLQFGSSALLDDSEEVAQDFPPPSARRNTSVPGPTMPFAGLYGDAAFGSGPGFGPWGQTAGGQPFGSSPPPPGMSSFAASQPWPHSLPNTSAFGPQTLPSRHMQRPTVRMRQLLCDACTRLASSLDLPAEDRLEGGFVSLEAVKEYVGREPFTTTPTDKDVLEIFETLGDATNGGGSFETTTQQGKRYVRWVRDGSGVDTQLPMRRVGGLGEIGSPVVSAGTPLYSNFIGRRTS